MSNFLCICFGRSDIPNHWYNMKSNHSTARAAERFGLDNMCVAGQFGFVVIEETKDTWKVLDDRSMLPPSGYSIGCKNTNIYIQPAPQLVLA